MIGSGALDVSCDGIRWKGLLDVLAAPSVPFCASFFKNGFLVSESAGGLVAGRVVVTATAGTGETFVSATGGGGGGESSFRSSS